MRALQSLLIVAWGVCLNTTFAFAQAVDERGAQEQIEPYHKHHDRRHGHNHVYPDRGAIIRDVPPGATVVNYAGLSYRFYEGIWFEPRGPAFIVVQPPIGLIVPSVPAFATVVAASGEPYLYANDVYYRARPDLGGYEVVNDPADTETKASAGTAAAGSSAAPGATAAALPAAAAPTVAMAAAAPTIAPAVAPPSAASPTVAPPVVAQAAVAPPPALTPATAPPASALVAAAVPTAAAAPATVPPAPAVSPPAAATPSVAGSLPVLGASPAGPKSFAVPKTPKGQDEQARDHYDCYRFAVAQSGFDPMRVGGGGAAAQSDFARAQAACFEGRGYTVQ